MRRSLSRHPLQRVGVLAVIAGADVLPARGDEDVAGEVEHGERDVERLGEAVAEALDTVQIDQARQLIPLGPIGLPLPHAAAVPSGRGAPAPGPLAFSYPARPTRERGGRACPRPARPCR